jgi:hypothetical protein
MLSLRTNKESVQKTRIVLILRLRRTLTTVMVEKESSEVARLIYNSSSRPPWGHHLCHMRHLQDTQFNNKANNKQAQRYHLRDT